jgi:hypothetical protein
VKRVLFFAVLLTVGKAGPAFGGPELPLRILDILDFGGALELTASRSEEWVGVSGADWHDVGVSLSQVLSLHANASILHPRFCTLNAHVRGGIFEEWWRQGEDHVDGIYGYGADVRFFPKHKISLSLHARESLYAKPSFRLGTVRSHTRSYSGALSWSYRALPGGVGGGVSWTSREIYGTEIGLEKRRAFLNLGQQQARKDWTTFKYLYEETLQDQEDFHRAENRVEVARNAVWGKGVETGSFLTRLSYRDSHIDTQWMEYRGESRLNVRHGPSLWFHWSGRFFLERYNDLISGSTEAGFHHKTYKSLDTYVTLGVGGDGGTAYHRERTFGRIRFDYRKRSLAGSTLVAGYTFNISLDRVDSDGAPIQVFDEVQTLSLGSPVPLAKEFALPSGVVVTSTDGSITYTPGTDYDLRERGNRIEIERLSGGTIPNGGAVAVDYRFDPAPDSVYMTLHHTAKLGITVGRSLDLLYHYGRTDFTIHAGMGRFREEESHGFRASVKADWGRASVYGDLSTGGWNPSRAVGVTVGLTPKIPGFGTPRIGGSLEERWSRRPRSRRIAASLDAGVNARFHPKLRTALKAGLRFEREEQLRSEGLYFTASANLTWRVGDWTMEGILRMDHTDRTRYQNHLRMSLFLHLALSRKF